MVFNLSGTTLGLIEARQPAHKYQGVQHEGIGQSWVGSHQVVTDTTSTESDAESSCLANATELAHFGSYFTILHRTIQKFCVMQRLPKHTTELTFLIRENSNVYACYTKQQWSNLTKNNSFCRAGKGLISQQQHIHESARHPGLLK